jgi:CheY-like chemotaxis protein/two-component sensor histidine kinase
MESIGQLTGGVAHDFNNLLTVILGNIDLAQEFERDGRGAKLLESALNAGERAAVLTKRLLAFARRQDLQPMPVDLKRLIGTMEDLLIRTLGPAIRLSVSDEPGFWPAQVDRNQIELIILNLAINARDAMPGGGSIEIALSNRKFTEGEATDLTAGEYVALTVSDTGGGMDDATLARAFEPFFTTKEVGKGTGLGLSMVHGTVIQSGGAVRIHSKPAQGTAVEIWLPRSREAPMTGHSVGVASAPEQGAGTILVCEDDPSVRTFVTEALENSGYRTIAMTDGPSALAILDADTPVDLLLVDLAMPEMDGAMVARLAQGRRPGLPILMVTGFADQKTVAAEASGVPVLRKPFKRAQLAARIAELLKESRGQDRTEHFFF